MNKYKFTLMFIQGVAIVMILHIVQLMIRLLVVKHGRKQNEETIIGAT